MKRTESPAQPVLLQDKLRLRIRTGPIRTAEVRLRVRVGDSKGSTCPAGRAPRVALVRGRKVETVSSAEAAHRAGLGAAAARGRSQEASGNSAARLSGPRPSAPSPSGPLALTGSLPLARPPAGL